MNGAVISPSVTVKLELDEAGWITGRVVEYPGCVTQARSLYQMGVRVREALALFIPDEEAKRANVLLDADQLADVLTLCRCGWTGVGDHPCHRCAVHKGERFFYVPHMRFSLAGVQMKFSARETWACVDCREKFGKGEGGERPGG